jgi:hypothetical protein
MQRNDSVDQSAALPFYVRLKKSDKTIALDYIGYVLKEISSITKEMQ